MLFVFGRKSAFLVGSIFIKSTHLFACPCSQRRGLFGYLHNKHLYDLYIGVYLDTYYWNLADGAHLTQCQMFLPGPAAAESRQMLFLGPHQHVALHFKVSPLEFGEKNKKQPNIT